MTIASESSGMEDLDAPVHTYLDREANDEWDEMGMAQCMGPMGPGLGLEQKVRDFFHPSGEKSWKNLGIFGKIPPGKTL